MHFSHLGRLPSAILSQTSHLLRGWAWLMAGRACGVWVAVESGSVHQPGTGRGICATWRGRALCGYKGAFVLRSDLDS